MLNLTAQDRCDRCGARAAYVATKPGLADLMFCGHHYRAHKDKLIEQYWLIETDETQAEPVEAPVYSE